MKTQLNQEKESRFLKSALTCESPLCTCQEALRWIQRRCHEVSIRVEQIRLSEMKDWYLDKEEGRVRHKSGRFFSIDGIQVNTNIGKVSQWQQPIINQPEIGFLGLICKEFKGVLYFLVQAKIEPGNISPAQISPTLQATKSNYTRAHKGKTPKFLDYFITPGKAHVLIDQLQSEQGARFLHKRNRNIIVEISEDEFIPEDEDFRWLTLGQIKHLASYDNVINMDLRTVISGIPFGIGDSGSLLLLEQLSQIHNTFRREMLVSALDSQRFLHPFDDIISWFTGQKVKSELALQKVSLSELQDWILTDERIHHVNGLYFDVRWVNVEIANREIASWQQPVVAPVEEGLIAFIVKKIGGIYHFLIQAKLESGNFDILEFAPTVQCITGSYRNSLDVLPFLKYVLTARPDQIRFDALLSEEGGRFFREQNRNLIVEADDDFPIDCPENYCWMTLHQLLNFIRFNNYLNIQARSLLSCLSFI